MHRRDFLKLSAALGAASALPIWSRSLMAAEHQPNLPVPGLLTPDARNEVSIIAQAGQTHWRGKTVKTWGYNGDFLGPTLRLKRGQEVNITVYNRLPEATTLHWHGLEIPGQVDGGPHAHIAVNGSRRVTFTPDQPAATCWFHPHLHGRTGYQVAQGLAGLVLIDDDESGRLLLPQQWGIDDIPVILQDKRLSADGITIDYQLDVMTAAVGWFGDTMLTNGAIYPRHAVPRGWVRLRLLNGCNARTLNVTASDKRPLYVIASDGGLLAEPVKIEQLPMMPGERFEVLVNMADGKAFDLQTLPVTQMGMTLAPFDQPLPLLSLVPLQVSGSGTLPDKLVTLPPVPAVEGLNTRGLQLMMDPELDRRGMQALMDNYGHAAMGGMDMSAHGMGGHAASGTKAGHQMAGMDHPNMAAKASAPAGDKPLDLHHANKINGLAFNMGKPAFAVKQGAYEKWTISGEGDEMLHPFHVHGTQFRILSENGKVPAPERRGWKDMVKVEGKRSEVLVRFNHLADKKNAYMAHCHLLEHEDTGMMLGFIVAPLTT